ncbi:protein of unknown function [Streptomyces sp. Termitarium-T10T-6]|nr:DUF397 domain-containing protein [Streptomyces sp. Termitarium-T10T-6]SCE61464.1 protein of unknown function [Streptomyces sp. Termitarium-T10T-6]
MNTQQTTDDHGLMEWRKSSYSGTSGGDCVEVAATPAAIHVRDSKNQAGPRLTLAPTTWAAFLGYAGAKPLS